jgi:hypothetical protein
MRVHWSGEIVGRPRWACCQDLRESLVGGRVDTLQPGKLFPELFELDLNSAYSAAAGERLPGGAAVRWEGHSPEPTAAATGYYLCRIEILEPLTLGPVVLHVDGEPNVIPSAPGVYRGWLWAEDIAALRGIVRGVRYLVTVRALRGWCWRRWAKGARSTSRGLVAEASPLSAWARRMHAARRRFDRDGERARAAMVKLATVAGIGRFAAGVDVFTLRRERVDPSDVATVHPRLGPDLPLWIHRSERDAATALVHWASYIQAAVRRRLWRMALPFAEWGGLVATNYDAVYLSIRPAVRSSTRAGEWKLERLQDAVIPAARQLRSRSKVRLPGIPRESYLTAY